MTPRAARADLILFHVSVGLSLAGMGSHIPAAAAAAGANFAKIKVATMTTMIYQAGGRN